MFRYKGLEGLNQHRDVYFTQRFVNGQLTKFDWNHMVGTPNKSRR